MDRTYDIFEKLQDGTMLWKASVVGHDAAIVELKARALRGTNEFRLMHMATNTVVAVMNVRPTVTD